MLRRIPVTSFAFFATAKHASERGSHDEGGYLERLASEQESISFVSMMGKQLSEQLTELIDPGSLQGQLPPNMTLGMLEMNLGLRWGMNEFR